MTDLSTDASGRGRQAAEHVYYATTKSLCAECRRPVDAKVLFRAGAVHLEKRCPDHGAQSALLASSVDWYLDCLSFEAPAAPPSGAVRPVAQGCPLDCGPCASHQQRVVLPVVPITSACNLDCPVCYTINRNERPYMMTEETFAAILERLAGRDDDLDIINFTGGEPTLHPDLPKLLRMARDAGIRRLTVSTNGLRLRDEAYVRELAAADVRIVLSLDTFDDATDRVLLGATTVRAKLEVLDLLKKHDVTTTILPAVAAGVNDRDVGKLLDLVLARPNLCSLELHTVAFTGQGGACFDRAARITVPDLHRLLAEHTNGGIATTDFVPSPLAHPHCYSICYLLMLDGGGYVPYARFMGRPRLFELLGDTLYVQPRQRAEEILRDALDELWARADEVPEAERIMATLKRLLREMFPPRGLPLDERRRIAERASKAIYIHSHMDQETFDVSRIMRCGVAVPDTDDSLIPTCAYNVLYRAADARFASNGGTA